MFTLSLLLRHLSGFTGRRDVALVACKRNIQNFSTFKRKKKRTDFPVLLSISKLVTNSDRGRLSDLNNISIINHSKLWIRELRVA